MLNGTRYTISGNAVIFSTYVGPYPFEYRTTWTPVWFETVLINDEDSLSGGGNETIGVPNAFTSPGKDVYLFNLVGLSYQSLYFLSMTGVNPSMGITHSTIWDNFETHNRNVMLEVDKDQVIQLQFKGSPGAGVGSSWGGFSVSGFMDPLVAFSVARSTSMTSQGLVTYDTEIVNTGQFNLDTSTFTAPVDGIYYFSISAGVDTSGVVSVFLRVNNKNVYNLFFSSSTISGPETIAGTTLLELGKGDEVSLHVTEGEIYSSPAELDISMSCFMYSPKMVSPVAWLVSKTTPDMTEHNQSMIFDQVHIIKRVAFINKTTVEIPFTGVYYLHLSVAVPDGDQNVRLELFVDNVVKYYHGTYSYSDIRGGLEWLACQPLFLL